METEKTDGHPETTAPGNGNAASTDDNRPIREFAHQVRTPLTAILGYTELLSMGEELSLTQAQIADYGKTVHLAAIQALRICERVLNDTVTGEKSIQREPIDFGAFAGEQVEIFRKFAAKKGVSLRADIPKTLPKMMSDPHLLAEIVGGLVSNAIKFTPKGGTVTIKAQMDAANDMLVLVISDTGQGIPAKALRDLIAGYRTVETTFGTNSERGWGLGLALAREHAQRLGSRLEIASEKGRGTIISFRQPVVFPDSPS